MLETSTDRQALHLQYLRTLEPWAKASAVYDYVPPDRPELLVYGAGYNTWGVQTHQKAMAALAVLATDPDLDEERAGMSREALLDRALRMLRFNLESHLEGSYRCTDGVQWGHTWISSLGVERMMHGVQALLPYMTDADHALLRTMLVSESTWLLDEYPIVAGPIRDNKPESNIWNGAVLHRTAAMYPDAPRAAEFREKGTQFLVNGISVPEDATSPVIYDGKPVSEWFVGHNFFSSYSLNHHGYLNVGYMVICLSNIAMLHFMYRTCGQEAPAALYHHARELWELVKQCTFPDGRLLRIGGDTRVRYCYCQDYAIPMWMMAAELFGDHDAVAFETSWLETLRKELAHNGDGNFLSRRCETLAAVAPLYYTRLESDRAVVSSMGAYWRRVLPLPVEMPAKMPGGAFAWDDEYHGAAFVRSEKRIASWAWRTAEAPQGLCLTPDASDLAEWRENLAGRIIGQGRLNTRNVQSCNHRAFDGGFLCWGTDTMCSEMMMTEGQQDEPNVLRTHLVFAALPDDTSVMVMQYAQTSHRRTYLTSVQGINWQVPNDLFNDFTRTYHCAKGTFGLSGFGSNEEVLRTGSRWLNVDDRLSMIGVYGIDELLIHRPGKRQILIKQHKHLDSRHAGGSLYADEICFPCSLNLRPVDADSVLFDLGFIMQAGADHEVTAAYHQEGCCTAIETGCPSLRAMAADGLDGDTYLLLANIGEADETVSLPLIGADIADLASGEIIAITDDEVDVPCPAAFARLFRVEK